MDSALHATEPHCDVWYQFTALHILKLLSNFK